MGQVNFLGIGAQKAGTTWLHSALSLHQNVSLHPLKELHFFNIKYSDINASIKRCERNFREYEKKVKILNELKESLSQEDIKLSLIKIKTLEKLSGGDWSYRNYFSLFEPFNTQIIGEITPMYAAIPEAGIREMRENLGDIKIVYMIRNPVKRAWSQFRMMYPRELKNLAQKERANHHILKLFNDRKKIFLNGSDLRTNYKSTIQLYSKYFGNIHYIFYDDLCNNPSKVLQEVCDFLEIGYEQEIFLPMLNQRKLEGIRVEMPNRLKVLLEKRYQEQEDYIKETFGRTLIY